ncbi:MAG: phospholipase D family protein [Thermoanaerobaculia bacterium]
MTRRFILLLSCVALAFGCAGFRRYQGPPEVSPPPPNRAETPLDRALADSGIDPRASDSGVVLLDDGEDALLARLALLNLAGRSLDLQTYIFELDGAGKRILARLLAAADRGVRVRLLLDDTTLSANEREWSAVDLHPLVEARAFNPFPSRRASGLARLVDYAADFSRLNHRMHDKVLIADGGWAIVGGRNVGNDYFQLSKVANFRDLDLLTAGRAAADVARVFDRFWNSGWAVPVSALGGEPASLGELRALRERLQRSESRRERFPQAADLAPAGGPLAVVSPADRLVRSEVRVLAEGPEKLEGGGPVAAPVLLDLIRAARRTVDVDVAYLVLPEAGVQAVREAVARGVRVRVLTNSLATNDVVATHAGYLPTRRALLEAGVEIWELRPTGSAGHTVRFVVPSGSRASLHSKAVVVDQRTVFLGSMNLDPRSLQINTEVGLLVESSELAAQLEAFFAAGREPENAWRVRLAREIEPALAGSPAGARVVWVEERANRRRVWRHEPQAGFWRRLQAFLLWGLPLRHQL